MKLEEVKKEIAQYEQSSLNISNLQILANLYTVKSHLEGNSKKDEYSIVENESVPKINTKSEFLKACEGVSVVSLLDILDEHMDAIKLIYSKEYQMLLNKIKALPKNK